MSGSRIIEISQPSLLEYVKKIIISHSFRITKKIKKNMGRYKVNWECHKQKINTKHL